MDVLSNDLLVDACKKNEAVGLIGSEELEEPLEMDREGYAVVFDPLDGSSLADVNLAVGTIVGIFEGERPFRENWKRSSGFIDGSVRSTAYLFGNV